MLARSALLGLFVLTTRVCAQQDPLFDAPLIVAAPNERLVKTLDLDTDGWVDAVGWWKVSPTNNRLAGWINDGAGHLVSTWNLLFPFETAAIEPHDGTAIGDFDGDGDDDFVVSNYTELRVYLSNGAALPTLAIVHPAFDVQGVATGDFDEDGDLEIAFNRSGTLEIRALDLAQGVLTLVSEIWTGYVSEGRLVAAELTGDTTPDLMVGGSRIFPVLAGVLQSPVIYGQAWPFDSGVSLRHDVGDIDGDGDLDVVTFRVAPSSYGEPAKFRVLRRTGPGTFAPELPQLGGPARRLFDVDDDGDLDGVCCGGGGPGSPNNSSLSNFRLAWNDGSGAFAPSIDIASVGSTAIAGVEDLDQDGDLDLVAGRCVYYARGSIQSAPFRTVGTRVQNERTLSDYDSDGDPDIELCAESVRATLGDGTEVPRAHALPPAPLGLPRDGKGAAGDWDSDGDVDLLVQLGAQSAPDGLELLRNVGCGVFESAGVVAGPTGLASYPLESEDSLAADVDGDGDLDLIRRTRSYYSSSNPSWVGSAWWRNEGRGGFVFAASFLNYVLLHVGDLNGDLVPDLLGVPSYHPTGYSSYVLQWRAGLGGGTFGSWTLINGSGSRPVAPGDQVSVADLDLDGDLDIASAYLYSSTGLVARVHLNTGTGGFVESNLYMDLSHGTQKPGAAVVSDLNLDGLPDLVFGAAKDAPNAAVIYLRKPDNTGWEAPMQQVIFTTLPGNPNAWDTVLSTRDLDGDRDIDLITSRFIEHLRYQLPDAGSRKQLRDGTAGSGSIVPTLGANGPFRVGMIDTLRLRGARPGSAGWLVAGYVQPSAPPFTGGISPANGLAQIEPLVASGVATDPAGSGNWSTTFPVPASDAGRSKIYEVRLQDPSAPNGEARSNHLVLSFGP